MPTLIALCGAPGAGKSEVQRILHERFKVHPVDDGWPLRDFMIRHCGATKDDVLTQAGKARDFTFPGGATMQMRKALGDLGNSIEDLLGPHAIAEMSIKSVAKLKSKAFSFGCVRRRQGLVYKRAGGIVVEVTRPSYSPNNGFDLYDKTLVDFTIHNDGSLSLLTDAVDHFGRVFLSR